MKKRASVWNTNHGTSSLVTVGCIRYAGHIVVDRRAASNRHGSRSEMISAWTCWQERWPLQGTRRRKKVQTTKPRRWLNQGNTLSRGFPMMRMQQMEVNTKELRRMIWRFGNVGRNECVLRQF